MCRIILFFICLSFRNTLPTTPSTTLDIEQRVDDLKRQIYERIRQKQDSNNIKPVDDTIFIKSGEYEYIDLEKEPITPIMDFDERKKHEKYKLRQLKTTASLTTLTEAFFLNGNESVPYSQEKTVSKKFLRHKKVYKKVRKPIDLFYRRNFDTYKDTPLEWLHCVDLITPFVFGFKKSLGKPKIYYANDNVVQRLIQLINVNTTDYSKDELYSILYQISNLNLRLFQWEVTAIKLLFRIIVQENMHTFANLKHGIKALFQKWRLDISNTTNLLKQARLFRPPCVKVSQYEGSTQTSKFTRYTKSIKHKKKCPEPQESDEC